MKIIVCIKQVPDTTDIKWTVNNTIDRTGVESVINPCDYYASEAALRIKDIIPDTEITVISMGPPQAESALREIIAMGADNAFLLSDKAFSGSDTASTARILAAAIKTKIPDFDLIICGQYASDGDTAQTGPELAQNLKISLVSNIREIESVKNDTIIVQKIVQDGIERIEMQKPALVCVRKNEQNVRLPKISGRIKAQDYKISVYSAKDISINTELIGFKGSPTSVKKAFRPEKKSVGIIYENKNSEEAAKIIISAIREV